MRPFIAGTFRSTGGKDAPRRRMYHPVAVIDNGVRLSQRIQWRYFIGEKSAGCMYVESSFSTSLLACSDLITS